jgi:DNA-binding NtrC family response regulator
MSAGRILVVDDDEDIVALVAAYLRSLDYTPICAHGSHEALSLIEHYSGGIDVVLTDCVMPGIGGLELDRIIARSQPGLPVIFMTSRPEVLRKLSEENRIFVQKPFELGDLSKVLKRVLQLT